MLGLGRVMAATRDQKKVAGSARNAGIEARGTVTTGLSAHHTKAFHAPRSGRMNKPARHLLRVLLATARWAVGAWGISCRHLPKDMPDYTGSFPD